MDPINSPDPKPVWLRKLVMVLIGAPGMILWIGGALLIAAHVSAPGWIGWRNPDPAWYLIGWVVPTLSFWIGRAMLVSQRHFRGFQDYRMPTHRLLAYVSLEGLELWVAAVTIGLMFGLVGALDRSALPAAAGWLVATLAGIALYRWMRKRRMRLGVRWQIELSRLKRPIPETDAAD